MRNRIYINAWLSMSIILALSVAICAQTKYVRVIAIQANLRGSADFSAKVLTQVKFGDEFELVKQQGAWFLVQTPAYVGWLHGSTIEVVSNAPRVKAASGQGSGRGIGSGRANSCVAIMSPDRFDLAVTCPENVVPTYLSLERDQGYDVAIVEADYVLLRERPKEKNLPANQCFSVPKGSNAGTEVPCEGSFLKKGDFLVLLDRTPINDWLNAANVSSGKEGWVYKGHVRIYYTRNPKKSEPSIASTYVSSDHTPEVLLKNLSTETFTIKVAGRSYVLPPSSSQTITITPGTYKFFGAAPGVIPVYGEHTFSKGYDYTWTFYIETVP